MARSDPSPWLLPLVILAMLTANVTRADETAPGEGRALLGGVLEARGGADLFHRLREVRRVGTLRLLQEAGEELFRVEIVVRPPDFLTLDTGDGPRRLQQILDGEKAVSLDADDNPARLDEARIESLQRTIRTDEAFVAQHALDGVLEILGVEDPGPGETPVEEARPGGTAAVLEDPSERQIRLVVEDAGGLPHRVDYEADLPSGERRPASEVFRDWRMVDGMLFPFEVLMFIDGRSTVRVTYESIEVDLAPEPAP